MNWEIVLIVLGSTLAICGLIQEHRLNPLFQVFLLYHWLRPLSPEEQELHCNALLVYCAEYLGGVRLKPPKVKLKQQHNEKNVAGAYSHPSKTITIYRNANRTNAQLVDSVLHEYSHFQWCAMSTNTTDEYGRIDQHFSYQNHPWEVVARTLAHRYRKDAHGWLLCHLGYSSKFVRAI
jgi:hypothetical protein